MSGPWEKYQAESKAPWEKYAELPDAEPAEPSGPGAGQAFLEHYGNAALMGHLPHAQALAEKLMPDASGGVDDELRAQGFDIQQPKTTYLKSKDQNIKRIAQEGKDFPLASGSGTVTGIVGGGLVAGRVLNSLGVGNAVATLANGAIGPVTRMAAFANRLGNAAKVGGVMGGLANPGDTEGDIDLMKEATGRLKGAGMGMILGPVMEATVTGAGYGSERVKDYLRNKAALKATRALGRPTPTQATQMARTGQDATLGRELLDHGAIPILGTPKRIQGRVEKLKDEAGEQIGQLLDDVDSQKVEYTPIQIKNPKELVKVQDEISATPVRFDENPMKKSMPWLKDSDAPPILVRGDEQPIQRALFKKPQSEVIRGETTGLPRFTVDSDKIADDLLRSPEVVELRKIPGMESTVAQLERSIETLRVNGKMTAREAHALRRGIDRSINFNKASTDSHGLEYGLRMQRGALNQEIADIVERAAPGTGGGALRAANRKYSNMATASDILEKEVGRNQVNRAISGSDTIAAVGGVASGSPLLGIALGALNKAGRTFGNSMQARGYDGAAKILAKVPALAALAQSDPNKFQAIVAEAVAATRGGFEERKPQDEELPLFQNQKLMEMLDKNPALIDRIADAEVRAKIYKKLGRVPAGK